MAQSETMHGGRARLILGNQIIGIFTDVSYGVVYDNQPIYVLGAFGPVEIVLTGQEAVSINATGWRVVGTGPHSEKGGAVPKLQDLLTHEDTFIEIFDRKNSSKAIMTVKGVRPTGYSTSISSRGVQQIQVSMIGLTVEDESGEQGEAAGATSFPK